MKKILKVFTNFLELTFIGSAVTIVVYFFIGQLLEVSGDSMLPNFKNSEQIIAEKLSVKIKPLTRGEVVIFQYPNNPGKLLIKRVVGLPGEKLKIADGYVYINNTQIDEMYLPKGTLTHGGTFLQEGVDYQLGPNAYVVFGDNRTNSTDSRDWGSITKEELVGRAILVYYPLEDFRIIFP